MPGVLMRTVLIGLVVVVGCNSDKGGTDTDATDGTDDEPEIETADTATEPSLDLTGKAGSVALVHWAPDAYNDDQHFAVGIFVEDDFGIDNLAACLFASVQCVGDYPAPGAPGVPAEDATIYTDDTYDVGDVQAGEVLLEADNSAGFPLYLGELTSLGGPGGVSLDGDFAPYSGTADYVVPDEIAVTSPDPTAVVQAVTGGAIELAWASPGAGGVFLEVVSGAAPAVPDTVTQLDDDGSHTILVDELQFRQPFDTKALVLSRIETSEVDAAGNRVTVQARSDQWIYLSFADTTGWTELVDGLSVGESCSDALVLPPSGAGQYYGDLSVFSHDHDLGDGNPLTNYGTLGFDAVLPVTLAAGQTLTATFRQDLDASIYLLDATCDEAAALAGADLTLDGSEEELVHTAAAAGTYYLVLDTWNEDSGSPFSLVLEVE